MLWPNLHTSCEGQTPPQPQDLCGWIGCSGVLSGPKKAPQPKDFSGWIGCSGGPPGALRGALDPAIGCAFFCHHDWSGQKPKIRILKPFQKRFPFFQKCSKPTFEDFGLFTAIRRPKGISTNFFGASPREKPELVQTFVDPKTCIFLRKAAHKQLVQTFILGAPFP